MQNLAMALKGVFAENCLLGALCLVKDGAEDPILPKLLQRHLKDVAWTHVQQASSKCCMLTRCSEQGRPLQQCRSLHRFPQAHSYSCQRLSTTVNVFLAGAMVREAFFSVSTSRAPIIFVKQGQIACLSALERS